MRSARPVFLPCTPGVPPAMSLLHRLNLLQKFLILGTIGLMMSALPTYV